MKDLKIKENILQEIMDLMDEKEGEQLAKHPKLIAAKVSVAKPVVEETEGEEMETEESDDVKPEGEISPEDLKKLLEHFKNK